MASGELWLLRLIVIVPLLAKVSLEELFADDGTFLYPSLIGGSREILHIYLFLEPYAFPPESKFY